MQMVVSTSPLIRRDGPRSPVVGQLDANERRNGRRRPFWLVPLRCAEQTHVPARECVRAYLLRLRSAYPKIIAPRSLARCRGGRGRRLLSRNVHKLFGGRREAAERRRGEKEANRSPNEIFNSIPCRANGVGAAGPTNARTKFNSVVSIARQSPQTRNAATVVPPMAM